MVYLFWFWFFLLGLLCFVAFIIPRIKNGFFQLFIPFGFVKDSYDTILRKQNTYYNALSNEERTEFIKRVSFFLMNKKITGMDGIQIGETERVSIGAAAVQLTFGLERNRFPDFKSIVVHANAYNCSTDNRSHRGDTGEDGVINLSWKYFNEGFAVQDDGINLALHEMAHALELEKMIIGTSFRGSFSEAYENWEKVATEELLSMRHTHKGFIRSYAAANLFEFFACTIEVFFEKSQAFKENLPGLYEKTCLLLRQDPARRIFRLKEKMIL